MFVLTMKTVNAAFDDDGNAEVARILQDVVERLEEGRVSGSMYDLNGHFVGAWSLS